MSMFSTAPITVGKNGPSQGSYDSIAVTPSDSVDVPANSDGRTPRRLFSGSGGNIAVNLTGGGTATLTGLTANTIYFVAFARVLATGTTATGIQALY